jgi:hypothetical protein
MNIWVDIEKLSGQTITTLDQHKPFDIVHVSAQNVIVRPNKTEIERKIPRDEIEGAYRRLVAKGVLTRSDIMEEFSNFNPAYVAAILSKLSGVTYLTKPIRLKINSQIID